MKNELQRTINILRFRPRQQQALLSDVLSLIVDGVPLNQSLQTIESIHDGAIAQVTGYLGQVLAQGQSLAAGMEKWFPGMIVELIRAGEESGQLESALQAAVRYYAKQESGIKTTIQSLVYPSAVVLLACLMTVIIKRSVLSDFASIKPVSLWPVIGQHLYIFANVMQYGWWLIASFVLVLAFAIFYTMYQVTGPARLQLDRLPVMSLYRQRTAAQLLETMGLLVSNGVSVQSALDILAEHASPYLAWHLLMMEYRLSSGQDNIADVLDTQLLDRHDMVRLRVVSAGKGFEQALISLGHQAYERYFQSMARHAKVLGGCLLVFGAGVAAMIVLGIYSVGGVVAA